MNELKEDTIKHSGLVLKGIPGNKSGSHEVTILPGRDEAKNVANFFCAPGLCDMLKSGVKNRSDLAYRATEASHSSVLIIFMN